MNLYNEQNLEIKFSLLKEIFQETLPPKEVCEDIKCFSFLFKREDEFVIELLVIDFENAVFISLSKENRFYELRIGINLSFEFFCLKVRIFCERNLSFLFGSAISFDRLPNKKDKIRRKMPEIQGEKPKTQVIR